MNNTIERAIAAAQSRRVMIFIRKDTDYTEVRATNTDTGKQVIKRVAYPDVLTYGNGALVLAIENAAEEALISEN